MTGPDVNAAIRVKWRRRIENIGRQNFGNPEMAGLGFPVSPDSQPAERDPADADTYTRVLDELSAIKREMKADDGRPGELAVVNGLIKAVRERRSGLLRAERQRKQALKAAQPNEQAADTRSGPTFLGRRVSSRLKFDGGDPGGLTARGLPVLSSFSDIADALEVTPQILQWLTYERGADTTDHYTRFAIPKRGGGRRLISTPKPVMRAAQQWVRTNVLVRLPVSDHAAAFRPGKSIADNARLHSGKSCVIRLDLRDFFGTVTFPRIRGFFESLGYNPGVATVLALICTDAPRSRVTLDGQTSLVIVGDRSLPQGACTSPDLANLITAGLDARIGGLARKFGYTYTRYADDLVLSTENEEVFAAGVISAVSRVCREEGFQVNHRKTRIMRVPNRQLVTGLLVNDGVRLTRSDLRRIRAFLHRCETQGVDAVSAELGKDARAVAHGYFAYIFMITPGVAMRLLEKHPWI
jgi:RNA-directed DNA polymerase